MDKFVRRDFIRLMGAAGAASALGYLGLSGVVRAGGGRVVIIGGGFGGATCANYIKRYDPGIEVTLIEPNKNYVTCPFSNTVLAGINPIDFITRSYDNLKAKRGVKVVNDRVTGIDPANRKVRLKGGSTLSYDRLVVSPGISFRWGEIKGYNETASRIMPHAWQAGPQTVLLRKQLEAMRDGGTVIIVSPPKPFRCPPGPYERAGLIAYYLKNNKPKSKILILDSSERFSKQVLFKEGWDKLYPGMIEWVAGSQGGTIERVDTKTMAVFSRFGESYKGDVINLIPPQKAGKIAQIARLANKQGWCPVNQRTFETVKQKGIHVIGDASIAGAMPKSGFAASSQARICAAAIVSDLRGQKMPEPTYNNTCYSFIGPKYAISVAAVYRLKGGQITRVSGGVSPTGAKKRFRLNEANYAKGWYKAITAEAFAG